MKINKKALFKLNKCYSIAPLHWNNSDFFLVASEKQDSCLLFDLEGNYVDTIWSSPGGTMSMVQVPSSNGIFLATQCFFSPNDSKEAKIVIVSPMSKGTWEIQTLVDLPHVHRFDIITRNGVNYLIACTLKSGHKYHDDWSYPGKIYVAILPNDLSSFSANNQLSMTILKEDLLKNHGYFKYNKNGVETSIISSENGIFQITPPESTDQPWSIELLHSIPASDAVISDFDNDGEDELAVFAPFHGSDISIYKKIDNCYQKVYTYEKSTEFLHAIYNGNLCGQPALIVGHRKGEQNLMFFTYDIKKQSYVVQILDESCGSANVFQYQHQNKDIVISANREIDEIAMYCIEE